MPILIPLLVLAAGAIAGNVLVGLAVAIAIPLGIELPVHFYGNDTPKGPQGQKRKADVIGNAVRVMPD